VKRTTPKKPKAVPVGTDADDAKRLPQDAIPAQRSGDEAVRVLPVWPSGPDL
jgi:hypothetical protein